MLFSTSLNSCWNSLQAEDSVLGPTASLALIWHWQGPHFAQAEICLMAVQRAKWISSSSWLSFRQTLQTLRANTIYRRLEHISRANASLYNIIDNINPDVDWKRM